MQEAYREMCALLAWGVVAGLRRALAATEPRSIWFGRRNVDGVLFPFVWLLLAYLVRDVFGHFVSVAAFRIAIPVLMSLLVIRLGVKVLQAAFVDAPWVRVMEQTISWLAWLALVALASAISETLF